MDFLDQVNNKIEENKTEMISSLSKLISMPSVAADETGAQPFGAGVQEAFKWMLETAENDGFATYNADNFGGHIDFPGKGPGIVGIIGHLDVVPEGDNWDFDPYGGEVIDGFVCGRGTMDDKGPVIASYYAMKALQQCGYKPDKTIRLILGLDEETNWQGMRYYVSQVPNLPDCGFTPDADFPVISAEMGILVFDLIKKLPEAKGKGVELTSIKGGTAPNSVPDYARAVINDTTGGGYEFIKEMVANARKDKGWKITCKGVGKSFEIAVAGVSAHGAHPEKGENAISILMDFLGGINFLNDGVADFISFYNSAIGFDLKGETIGCAMSDEISGDLVFNVGMIDVDKKTAKVTINVRYPVSCEAEDVYAGLETVMARYDMGVVKGKHQWPLHVSDDSPLVKTLMGVYAKHTGDTESKPLVIGGGTYARAMDNIVAFGARFPGEAELGHQRNERISIENLMKLTRIYAEAAYELSKDEVQK
ncbi:MAG: dipeptidase PepV [Firmicutes bacterium]|nr:dipeptidase PepV [Bacillota bacterium]